MLGKRFTRLLVVASAGVKDEKRQWLCLCDCGTETTVITKRLNSGHTRSCGCLKRELHAAKCRSRATHGMTKSRTYKSWQAMKERCLNPRATRYPQYGAKGVSVCQRWLTFENFLADLGERPAGMTLDRINNARGYEPENCRWATYATQTANRSRTRGWTVRQHERES
jgi:hypothetical protein